MLLPIVVMILILSGESSSDNHDLKKVRDHSHFELNTSKNVTKISDQCYKFRNDSSYDSALGQLMANLSVESMEACKMYCWYHKQCQLFAFNTQTSACSLYNFFQHTENSSFQEYNPSFDVTGIISCFMNLEESPSVPCRTIESAVKTSQDLEGVLLQDSNSRLCFGFGRSMELKWKDCQMAIPWIFEEKTDAIRKETKFKLRRADSLGSCLEVGSDSYNVGQTIASLATCQMDNVNQLFEMTRGSLNQLSKTMDPEGNDKKCYFSIMSEKRFIYPGSSEDIPLNLLRVLLPVEHLALCQRNKFKVPNGQVEGKLPFYLPGSNISVRCKPGFGFVEFDFQSALNITCQNNMTRNLKCAKVDTITKPEGKSPLITILVCGNVLQTVFIIFLGVLVVVLAKKIRTLRKKIKP